VLVHRLALLLLLVVLVLVSGCVCLGGSPSWVSPSAPPSQHGCSGALHATEVSEWGVMCAGRGVDGTKERVGWGFQGFAPV